MNRFACPSSVSVSSSAPAAPPHHQTFRNSATTTPFSPTRSIRDRSIARASAPSPHFSSPVTLPLTPSPSPSQLHTTAQQQLPPHPAPGSCPAAAPCNSPSSPQPTWISRRTALAAAAAAAGLGAAAGCSLPAYAAELALSPEVAASAQVPDAAAFVQYKDPKYNYVLSVPSGWEKIDKAGANVLFEDPGRRSSSLGVTVNPVRVADIGAFGSLEQVGDKLIQAEKKKESTLSASMLSQSTRQSAVSAALLYDFEYDLDSTRGRKRVLNTVTIYKSRLYILNGMYKCEKEDEGCSSDEAAATLGVLRVAAASFGVV